MNGVKYGLTLVFFGYMSGLMAQQPTFYPRNFRDNIFIGVGIGYAYSDPSGYNRWARWQGYQPIQGNYVPITIDFNISTPKGNVMGMEFTTHAISSVLPMPNASMFMLRRGYNVRSWKNMHLVTNLGLGINTQRMRFKQTTPPSFAGLGFNNLAYCRRTSLVASPEINLYFTQLNKKNDIIAGFKLGANLAFLQGRWRYGVMTEDGFDSEIVDFIPNVTREFFYLKFYIAFSGHFQ